MYEELLAILDFFLIDIFISCQFIAGPHLEHHVLFRIIEVLHSSYKSGHIQIADHISFLITLLSSFSVFPGTSDKSKSGLFMLCI